MPYGIIVGYAWEEGANQQRMRRQFCGGIEGRGRTLPLRFGLSHSPEGELLAAVIIRAGVEIFEIFRLKVSDCGVTFLIIKIHVLVHMYRNKLWKL